MHDAVNFVAVDLGASSGRLMVGHWDGRRFSLDELHRFPNSGVSLHGSLYWDALRIWSEIQNGLIKFRARFPGPPAGIAVDAWGVDFALLDGRGRLLDNPSHYRDPRTNGIPQRLFQRIPEADLFAATGVQSFQYNTLFQLYSMVLARRPQARIRRNPPDGPRSLQLLPRRREGRRVHRSLHRRNGQPRRARLAPRSAPRALHSRSHSASRRRPRHRPLRCRPRSPRPLRLQQDLPRHRRRLARYSQRRRLHPQPRRAQRIHQQRHLEPHGRRARRARRHPARPPVALHQRGRLRQLHAPPAQSHRPLAPAGVPPPVGERGPRLHLGRPHRRRRRGPALPLAHPSRCPRISRARGHAPGHSLLLPIHRPARARIRRRLRALLLRGPQPLLLVHARCPALPHRPRHSHPPRSRRRLLESISLPDDSRRLRM